MKLYKKIWLADLLYGFNFFKFSHLILLLIANSHTHFKKFEIAEFKALYFGGIKYKILKS